MFVVDSILTTMVVEGFLILLIQGEMMVDIQGEIITTVIIVTVTATVVDLEVDTIVIMTGPVLDLSMVIQNLLTDLLPGLIQVINNSQLLFLIVLRIAHLNLCLVMI